MAESKKTVHRVPEWICNDYITKPIHEIANREARSLSQICELLLSEGVQAYRKEGPKFLQRLVAKQKARIKDS